MDPVERLLQEQVASLQRLEKSVWTIRSVIVAVVLLNVLAAVFLAWMAVK